VRLEGLGQWENFNDLIGNRTRDLPACSIAPQPTTLLRTPLKMIMTYTDSTIKTDRKEIGFGGLGWIHLAHYRDQ
jgi:hypothetical protein